MAYIDPFGRLAEVERWKMEQDRLRQQDAVANQMNALKLAEYNRSLADLQQEQLGKRQTQNALRSGLENIGYLQQFQNDPQAYNEILGTIQSEAMRGNPYADPTKVAGIGKFMEPAKPQKVQTVTTAEGVFTLTPEGKRGERIGSTPARGGVTINTGGKPLPAPVLRMQQDELDALATASGIKTDLGQIRNQITSGKLQLGPLTNWLSKGQNVAGLSSESSRNFATFNATLEKMRNDSLRLNKGVQTEGDAQRAWNELFTNLNDKDLVLQRLGEIERINNRAAQIRKQNVKNIRDEYQKGALDISIYENPPAAVGDVQDLTGLSDEELLGGF